MNKFDYSKYLDRKSWTPKLASKVLAGINPNLSEDEWTKEQDDLQWNLLANIEDACENGDFAFVSKESYISYEYPTRNQEYQRMMDYINGNKIEVTRYKYELEPSSVIKWAVDREYNVPSLLLVAFNDWQECNTRKDNIEPESEEIIALNVQDIIPMSGNYGKAGYGGNDQFNAIKSCIKQLESKHKKTPAFNILWPILLETDLSKWGVEYKASDKRRVKQRYDRYYKAGVAKS